MGVAAVPVCALAAITPPKNIANKIDFFIFVDFLKCVIFSEVIYLSFWYSKDISLLQSRFY
jgi:hypothetical protein